MLLYLQSERQISQHIQVSPPSCLLMSLVKLFLVPATSAELEPTLDVASLPDPLQYSLQSKIVLSDTVYPPLPCPLIEDLCLPNVNDICQTTLFHCLIIKPCNALTLLVQSPKSHVLYRSSKRQTYKSSHRQPFHCPKYSSSHVPVLAIQPLNLAFMNEIYSAFHPKLIPKQIC